MTSEEFNIALAKINKKLDTNFIAVDHTKGDKMFVMPISLLVSRDRDGLKKIFYTMIKLQKRGINFTKKFNDRIKK